MIVPIVLGEMIQFGDHIFWPPPTSIHIILDAILRFKPTKESPPPVSKVFIISRVQYVWMFCLWILRVAPIWAFPKNRDGPPKSSILIGFFTLFPPSILGVFPLFLETPFFLGKLSTPPDPCGKKTNPTGSYGIAQMMDGDRDAQLERWWMRRCQANPQMVAKDGGMASTIARHFWKLKVKFMKYFKQNHSLTTSA